MGKKYVATIMNRIYSKDDNFIYIVGHTEVGELESETGIFTDRNGNEYISMLDPSLMISELTEAYYNLVEMKDIPKYMATDTIREGISDYNYRCGRYIYYVSRVKSDVPFVIPISMDEMKYDLEATVNRIEENGGVEKMPEEQTKIGQTLINAEGEESEEELPYHGVLYKDIEIDINSLLIEIMEGVYSIEQLKEMKSHLELQRDALDSFIDSLELQIEASEKGESSITLKGETPAKKQVKKKEEPKKIVIPEKNYINLKELFDKVTKTLIAQDEPTRRVITEIARKEQSPANKNRALLITGPTGSGKTKMMQLIAKYLDRPFFKIDATQLTIPGYVGKDLEEALWDLYISCGKDKKKAEQAIIFFDEIDKKGSSKKDDVSGRGVLNILLPFIEGATYDATESVKNRAEVVKIDTSNMIVILGGAFTDVYKNLTEANGIGFGSKMGGNTREATTEDFVEKAKMPDEFMGRVSIIKLNDLDVDAIKRIMLESDESAIRLQQKLFDDLGVKLTLTDDYISAIANQAVKKKTGARGLNTVVDETTWEAYGDAYSHLGEYSEIILDENTVQNPKQYQKVYRKVKEGE